MMAWLVLGVDEWLGVKRDDLRGLFECSMEGVFVARVEGLVVSVEGLGARGVEGCCHGDVRWWVRWFNGGCRMKVVKWKENEGR
ncbi:hypothetical protein V6N13_108900 [Hibiscus sabdariffa]